MNKRSLFASIFGIIIAIELISFMLQPTPYKQVRNGEKKTGLFSGYDTVTDYDAQKNTNTKFIVVIGATLLIGALITFNIPNTKIDKIEMKNPDEIKIKD